MKRTFEVRPVVEYDDFITPFDSVAEAEFYREEETNGEGEIFWGLYLRDDEDIAEHILDRVSAEAMRETIKLLLGLDIPMKDKKVVFSVEQDPEDIPRQALVEALRDLLRDAENMLAYINEQAASAGQSQWHEGYPILNARKLLADEDRRND